MKIDSSAIGNHASLLLARSGLLWGLLGVLAFSFTVPFTRIATHQMDATFVGLGRAVVAGLLATVVLAVGRPPRPRGRQWVCVIAVAAGVVVGFPLLTSLALRTESASHTAVVIGLLPAATAVVAVIRGGERPSRGFWICAAAGASAVIVFVATTGTLGAISPGDLLVVGAVVAAAVGYAEGGLLARSLGAGYTVCWALVISLPLTAAITATRPAPHASVSTWAAFGYLGVVSMFLGFFAWYRGLAIGPIATVGQVQLVQPVFTLCWAAVLLGETIGASTVLGAVAVVGCAAAAVRMRVRRPTDESLHAEVVHSEKSGPIGTAPER
ncbi:DMT family transporter [Gordonia jinhuaensis]|uniref:Membrane protein n=1 Tax=Gordonia jinhuaensis TaxID=1517702 RepID=A0A916X0G1_9ACTN|nr:DMT family transporter [Gordonia jinhuaensis]GGB45138.1 membrane protein [Gordonia jinhuaensis]